MSPEQAIEIIAKAALADAAEWMAGQWERYPEIGEHDWTRVVDALDRLAPYPAPEEFAEAYELLEARAER